MTHKGHLGFVFMQRLNQLAFTIRGWQNNKLVFSKSQKQVLVDEINSIDLLEAQNLINVTHSEKRKSLKADLEDLERKEALYWSQMAKKLWIEEGDENSTFFSQNLLLPTKEELDLKNP